MSESSFASRSASSPPSTWPSGLFAAIAPGTFYEEIGPYGAENGHYVGDVAAFYLAAGIALAVAVDRPAWRVPVLTLVAVWCGLHALNHLGRRQRGLRATARASPTRS